jgi:hypothetical protein
MLNGPAEYVVLRFPGNRFDGTLVPALRKLTDNGVIHIIDLVFITKDADGEVRYFEFDELPGDATALADLEGEAGTLMSDEDIELIAANLDPNSSAALLVWEDLWAIPVTDALSRCGAALVDGGRIPVGTLERALAGSSI